MSNAFWSTAIIASLGTALVIPFFADHKAAVIFCSWVLVGLGIVGTIDIWRGK